MLRSILFFCCVLLVNLGCSQSKATDESTYSKVPLEKQITYMLQLNMKLPYELYINDIKADYDYIGGNIGVDMNPYILKNGKCKIKMKIFPAFKVGKTEILLDDLQNSTILFGKYIMDKEKNDVHSYNIDDFTKLDYKMPNKPVPSFEQEWEVEIKELPYELEGWSKGQDLRKLDQKELEQKVVEYHKKMWKILNDGDFDQWQKVTQKRFEEYIIYNYLSKQKINENIKKNKIDITEYTKNTMIPLDNFEMKLYGEGKIVTLEKKIHTNEFANVDPLDIYSWNPLISKGKVSGAADYSILLYLPEGSNEFVIIRK